MHTGKPQLANVLRGRLALPVHLRKQHALLVQRHRVAHSVHRFVGGLARQAHRVIDPAVRLDRVPQTQKTDRCLPRQLAVVLAGASAVSLAEGGAHFVVTLPLFVAGVAWQFFQEQLHRVRDQVLATLLEQPTAVDESGQRACRVGTAAEAEHEDGVAFFVVLHQVGVGLFDVLQQPAPECRAHDLTQPIAQRRLEAGVAQRADTGVVVGNLLANAAPTDLEQLDDVGVFLFEKIAGAIQTDHDVLGHVCDSSGMRIVQVNGLGRNIRPPSKRHPHYRRNRRGLDVVGGCFHGLRWRVVEQRKSGKIPKAVLAALLSKRAVQVRGMGIPRCTPSAGSSEYFA